VLTCQFFYFFLQSVFFELLVLGVGHFLYYYFVAYSIGRMLLWVRPMGSDMLLGLSCVFDL